MNNADVQLLKDSRNSKNNEDFIQPTFVLNMERKAKLMLPAGWEACMLNDSRVYYFNREKWVSSWSLPKEEFVNDAPYGWQKYYDDNGKGFYYHAQTQAVTYDLPTERITVVLECPNCNYVITEKNYDDKHCPCCNSSLTKAFN